MPHTYDAVLVLRGRSTKSLPTRDMNLVFSTSAKLAGLHKGPSSIQEIMRQFHRRQSLIAVTWWQNACEMAQGGNM